MRYQPLTSIYLTATMDAIILLIVTALVSDKHEVENSYTFEYILLAPPVILFHSAPSQRSAKDPLSV